MEASKDGKQLRVTKKTLQTVLEQCQRAMELLKDEELVADEAVKSGHEDGEEEDQGQARTPTSSEANGGYDSDELCDLLKSKVESLDFLDKLGRSYISVSHQMSDENATWDIVSADELWEDKYIDGENESKDGFILVKKEDIVDGIASFMAAYLSSLEQTKELTPDQLQKALCKTFSLKKKKSKLRKAWDRSIVVYNVASWSATAFGMYQNPAVFKVASAAFWSSSRVISKLL